MKKSICVFVSVSILWLSGTMFSERQGAEVLIKKKNGQRIQGELIAVKKSSVLVLGSESHSDEAAEIGDISFVQIVKKSNALKWGGIGLAIGVVGGLVGGFASGDDEPGFMSFSADQKAGLAAMGFGLIGLAVGSVAGMASGADVKYQFEGKSESEIRGYLAQLAPKSRVPHNQ